MNIDVRLKFEPRDIWVGIFWQRIAPGLEVYVCLLPMLPLRFVLSRR